MRYFYGNTRIAGHAFGYHGEPLVILKGRLLGALALAIYVGLGQFVPAAAIFLLVAYLVLVPWVVTRARMFQMRMTSWRGVRFEFEADYAGAFKTLFLAPVLSALSLGIAMPWAVRLRYQWLIENTAYGSSYFKLDIGLKPVAFVLLKTLGVALLAMLVSFGGIMALGAFAAFTFDPETATPDQIQAQLMLAIIPMYLLYLIGGYIVYAFWRRSILNLMLPASQVGPLRLQCALSARKLAWIYLTNIAGIIVTLGLFTPWARVRAAKYLLESTGYVAEGPIEAFVAIQAEKTSAVGEEVGELFDVGIGI